MQKIEDDIEIFSENDQADLDVLLTHGLGVVTPEHPEVLKQRLMARISRSSEEHAGLLTVRFNRGQWRHLRKGVRYKLLWQGPGGSSVLIELMPGAALPRHRHYWVEEGIVLEGLLLIGDQELSRFDYHVSPSGSRHDPVRSDRGALAYLRGTSLGRPWAELGEFAGGLLPFRGAQCKSVYHSDTDWIELAPGLQKKTLWTDGITASSYYRIAPGTSMAGHPHRMSEECLVLSGDIFLGDILLQAGDYQLAPAGSRHGEIYSDNGSLLFVRGAADCCGENKQPNSTPERGFGHNTQSDDNAV